MTPVGGEWGSPSRNFGEHNAGALVGACRHFGGDDLGRFSEADIEGEFDIGLRHDSAHLETSRAAKTARAEEAGYGAED